MGIHVSSRSGTGTRGYADPAKSYVIFVAVCGWKDGRYLQETYANKIYAGIESGHG